MVKVTKYPHGTISWMDGISTQFEADRDFYQTVFGWDVEMFGEVYCLFKKEGDTVAGFGRMPDAMRADGVKSQ
ncbi:MAG: hypothetical protein AAF846_16055 [Chloroflexota bacterium]